MKKRDRDLTIALVFILAILILVSIFPVGNFYTFKSAQEEDRFLIKESNSAQDVNYPGETVDLEITGDSNSVRIFSSTEINKLTISGNSNVVHLCSHLHSPVIKDTGSKNKIQYEDC